VRAKYRVVERLRNKYPVQSLCRILEITRSGYYAWRKRIYDPDQDAWLKKQVMACQQQCNFTYGYRRVRLWIQQQTGRILNAKPVLRIMRKLDVLAQIRRARPYTYYKQAIHRYENLLQRQFYQEKPNCFWATDITYIPTAQGMAYMCAVIDLCGKMVLNYRIGNDMTVSLVTDTIQDALKNEKATDGLALHSDQGSQYTSSAYYNLSKEYHFQPSMSNRGCPYDNSSMENFFGTLKAECLNRMTFPNREFLSEIVAEYVSFYNYERINLKNGLTPYEIRSKAM